MASDKPDSPLPASTKRIRPPEERRRSAKQARIRSRREREERARALSRPDEAEVRPATISIRDFKLATGLSAATIFRRLKDPSPDRKIQSIKSVRTLAKKDGGIGFWRPDVNLVHRARAASRGRMMTPAIKALRHSCDRALQGRRAKARRAQRSRRKARHDLRLPGREAHA